MSRNSEKNRKERRARAAARAKRQAADPLYGLRGPDRIVVPMIATMWGRLDDTAPTCAGPTLLHDTGFYECLGTCEDPLEAHHPGSLTRCRVALVDHSRIACPSCWSRFPHEIVPACPGLLLRHPGTGPLTCTDPTHCPGVDQEHGQTAPCAVLEHCPVCSPPRGRSA